MPPAEAWEDLDEFLEPRRSAAPFRWTQADQVHLTLAFLADVEAYRLDELAERLARAAARRGPVGVRIAGGGAYPHVAGARVLWAGLATSGAEADAELRRTSEGARAAAARTGIAVDGRRFRPHLTVGRCGRPTELTRWVQLLDAYRGPAWDVDRISLVESHLGEGPRGRPRYEVLEEFPLG